MEENAEKFASLSLGEIKTSIKNLGGARAASRYYGIHHTTVLDRLSKEGLNIKDIMWEFQNEIAPKVLEKQEMVHGDCMITADHHLPFVSMKWIDRCVEIGKKEGLTRMVIGGDFHDIDRLSWWLRVKNFEDLATPLEHEMHLSEMVLDRLEEQFTEFHILGGNHWLRLAQQVSAGINMRTLFGMMDRKSNANYHFHDHFQWLSIDGKVRVTHPMKSRKLDHTLSRDLSIVNTDESIVVAHRHRANEGVTPDGKRQIVEVGWMGDLERMRYVQHTDSTYYKWVNGFCTCINGKLRNYTELNYQWTD